VTEKAKAAAAVPSKLVGGSSWQIRRVIQRREVSASRPAREDEVFDAPLPGKASKLQVVVVRTVNRHWWVSRKSAKALERTLVKELCKLIP
jgi:hypothetical protein